MKRNVPTADWGNCVRAMMGAFVEDGLLEAEAIEGGVAAENTAPDGITTFTPDDANNLAVVATIKALYGSPSEPNDDVDYEDMDEMFLSPKRHKGDGEDVSRLSVRAVWDSAISRCNRRLDAGDREDVQVAAAIAFGAFSTGMLVPGLIFERLEEFWCAAAENKLLV